MPPSAAPTTSRSGAALEERPQPATDDRVIVDHEHLDRVGLTQAPSGRPLALGGRLDPDDGPLARPARDAQLRPDLGGAAAHRFEAEVAGWSMSGSKPRPSSRISTTTCPARSSTLIQRRARLRVLDDVPERLAPDPKTCASARGASGRRPSAPAPRSRGPRPGRASSRGRAGPARARPRAGHGPARRSGRGSRSARRGSAPRSPPGRSRACRRRRVPSWASAFSAVRVCSSVENSAWETESCRSRAIRWRSCIASSPSRRLARASCLVARSRSLTMAARNSVVIAVTTM